MISSVCLGLTTPSLRLPSMVWKVLPKSKLFPNSNTDPRCRATPPLCRASRPFPLPWQLNCCHVEDISHRLFAGSDPLPRNPHAAQAGSGAYAGFPPNCHSPPILPCLCAGLALQGFLLAWEAMLSARRMGVRQWWRQSSPRLPYR